MVEGVGELGCDDVGVDGAGGVVDAVGEAQHEVALVDGFGDLDQLAQQRHRSAFPESSLRFLALVAGRRRVRSSRVTPRLRACSVVQSAK